MADIITTGNFPDEEKSYYIAEGGPCQWSLHGFDSKEELIDHIKSGYIYGPIKIFLTLELVIKDNGR